MDVLVTIAVIAHFFARLSISVSTSVNTDVHILPSSMTTFIGEEVEFRCIAPFNGISWFINDTNVIDVHFIQKIRRLFTARQDGNPGEESMLVITTNLLANNSVIKCSVRDRSGTRIYSSEAQLRSQGLLLPPSNIQIDYQPYSLQIVISWQQPFTLNITHQGQEDIIVYNIFVCTYFESPESFGDCEVYNTSNTWYTYNYSSVVTQPDLVCNKSVLPFFQLSSINRVGESARSEPLCLRNVLCTSTPGPIELKSTITLTGISTNSVTIHSTMYTVHKPNETIGPLTTVTMITITVGVPIFVILLLGTAIMVFCSVATNMYSKATRDTSGHVNTMELTINDAYEIPTEQSHHNLNSFKLLETKKTDGYCIKQSESIYAEIS